MREQKTGVLGASTLLGRELLVWLDQWRFPCTPFLFDETEQSGRIISYQDHYLPLCAYDERIASCDILFDCRMDKEDKYKGFINDKTYIIALGENKAGKRILPKQLEAFHEQDHVVVVPQAAEMMLEELLAVVRSVDKVKHAWITSLHSAAEFGDAGCEDLNRQLVAYGKHQMLESHLFPLANATQKLPLLFQALPQTTPIDADGITVEEKQLMQVGGDDTAIHASCVRIGALRGMAMSAAFTCEQVLNKERVIDCFAMNPGFICFDDATHNMYPICADVLHDHHIYIGRMRLSDPHTFMAWAVCDDIALRCASAVKLAFYILHNFL